MPSLKTLSVNKDITIAETIDSDFYLNKEYYILSLNKIFSESYQFITDLISFDCTQYPFIFLESSINEHLLLTKKEDEILCLHNVCTHRGNIVCLKKNSKKSLQCSYHGKVFNLKGKFLSMPGFEGVKNFPTEKDNLLIFPVKIWKNFIFAGINPEINIKHFLSDVDNKLGWYPFENLELIKEKSQNYEIDAHWALYCENYLEGFHIPHVHKGLNSDIDYSSYKTELLDNGVLQYTCSSNDKDRLPIPEGCINSDKNIYAYYYWLFPNMMFNFYSWGLSINIIEPITINKTRIRFLSYVISGAKQVMNTASSVDVVEEEDQRIVQSVQKGIQSSFYNRGRYSAKHEKGTHHFHRLICKYLK